MLYDSLLLIAVWFLATVPFIAVNDGEAVAPYDIRFQIYIVVVTGAYFIGFWCWGGQTAGMRAWRLIVSQTDGERISVGQGAVRAAIAVLSIACAGLGFAWALLHPRHATWHDLASRTELRLLPPIKRKRKS